MGTSRRVESMVRANKKQASCRVASLGRSLLGAIVNSKADAASSIDDCLFIGMRLEWHYIIAAYVDTRCPAPFRFVTRKHFNRLLRRLPTSYFPAPF